MDTYIVRYLGEPPANQIFRREIEADSIDEARVAFEKKYPTLSVVSVEKEDD